MLNSIFDKLKEVKYFNGNVKFMFLCNPQKSTVNEKSTVRKSTVTKKAIVCFYNITWVKKTFKRSCFRNISNFHNGFV